MASVMKKSSSQPTPRGSKAGAGGNTRGSKAGAGAAGVGGGTVLVAIANSMKDSNPLKSWLLLAAPSLSVFLSVVWLWLSAKFSNYLDDKELLSERDKLRKIIQEGMKSPSITEEHHKYLQKELEEIDVFVISRYKERMKYTRMISESDFQSR
jgi:hypothetical protein